MEKTETKAETLNRLFKENGLLPEDIHKHAHYTIITRAGIEKIQAKNRVTAKYKAVVMERDFAVIKGVFSMEGVPDLQTFGSASKETSQNKYYPEMAEKRCLSRGVLKICRFYELGVFGEDESDDFKKAAQEGKAESKSEPIQKLQSEIKASAEQIAKIEHYLSHALLSPSDSDPDNLKRLRKAYRDSTAPKAEKAIEWLAKELDRRERYYADEVA